MLRKLKIFAITSAVVIIVGFALWFWFFSPMGVSIRRSDDIATTKTYVTAMRDIGQWEFLAINDEELVDTVDKGFFSDKELIESTTARCASASTSRSVTRRGSMSMAIA